MKQKQDLSIKKRKSQCCNNYDDLTGEVRVYFTIAVNLCFPFGHLSTKRKKKYI